MATEEIFPEPLIHFGNGDVSFKQKCDDISAPKSVSGTTNGCFDCSICLDSAHDPVVTLCGHLYCWPCIHKWLQVQSSPIGASSAPKCAVCKAYIKDSSLVPLYGRGTSSYGSETKKPQPELLTPPRPHALSVNAHINSIPSTSVEEQFPSYPFQAPQQSLNAHQHLSASLRDFTAMAPSSFRSTPIVSPIIGMFGELAFATIFRSSDASLFSYPYQNSYNHGSPRMRRQEIQLDKSLNRLSLFFFICMLLCLFLF